MMKSRFFYTLLFLAVTLFLNACRSSTETSYEADHHHEAATGLSLHGRQKWKSDSATDNNVAYLKNRMDIFIADPAHGIGNYQDLGNDLVEALHKMIRECKMSGPGHDALHVWLAPVIEQSHQLKTVADTVQAGKILEVLKERISVYTEYFEKEIK